MKPKKFLIAIVLTHVIAGLNAQNMPTPAIWLKADNTGYFDRMWQDVSSNNRHAVFSSDTTILAFGQLINYNPSISFEALGDSMFIENFTISDKLFLKAFVVFRNDVGNKEKCIWGVANTMHHKLLVSNMNIYDEFNCFAYDFGKSTKPVMLGVSKFWDKINEGELSSLFLGGTAENKSAISSLFNGEIAEFILFDNELTQEENQIVQTYLAIKYGIGILQTSYLNSGSEIIWDIESNIGYDMGVFGIGRDNNSFLNQKQATNDYGVLSVAANKFYQTNNNHPAELENKSFILFSNNGEVPIERENSYITENASLLFNTCQWKVNIVGTSIKNMPTTLKVNRKELFEDTLSQLFLVIDENGNDLFSSPTIIEPDSITNNGDAYFSNLTWGHSDNSDYFTFALHSDMKLEITNYPPVCEGSWGAISCKILGGEKPYNIKLLNLNNEDVFHYQSNENFLKMDSIPAGIYRVDIRDNKQNRWLTQANELLVTSHLATNINPVYYIKNEPVHIVIDSIPGYRIISYSWLYNDIVVSELPDLTIDKEGAYKLLINTEQNCEVLQEFYVADLRNNNDNNNDNNNGDGNNENNNGSDITNTEPVTKPDNLINLYPNPSKNGNYTIDFNIEAPIDIVIEITSISGKSIEMFYLKNIATYQFEGNIAKQGIYIITIRTKDEKVFSKKLIIGN